VRLAPRPQRAAFWRGLAASLTALSQSRGTFLGAGDFMREGFVGREQWMHQDTAEGLGNV
jgi:hypothetical protein